MKWAIAILMAVLVITNAYWVYRLIYLGVTLSYRDDQSYRSEETRKQLIAMLPLVAENATREEIMEAANRYTEQDRFEKDGCTWVEWLGLKFGCDDRLKLVSRAWAEIRGFPERTVLCSKLLAVLII